MGSIFQNRKFCIARAIFRWTRIVVWFAIFLVVVAVAYLHLIGLPDFLKGMLLARLEKAGFEASFSSVRLGWGPDLAIEDAFFRRAAEPLAPRLSAAGTRLNFDLDALRRLRIHVRSFEVEGAKLEFPLSTTNAESLSVSNVVLGVDFTSGNIVQISEASGDFRGMQISLDGIVTNYAALLQWKPFHLRPRNDETFQEQLRKLAETLNQIHFNSAPHFRFHATADGLDPDSLRAEMAFSTGPVQTPWGRAAALNVSSAVAHLASSGGEPFLRVHIAGADFSTPQGRAGQIELTTVLSRTAESNLTGTINFQAAKFHHELRSPAATNSFDTDRIHANATATLDATNFALLAGAGTVEASQLAAQPGSAQQVELDFKFSAAPPSPAAGTNWGLWTLLDGYTADWQARLIGVASPKLQLERLNCSGQWRSPVVKLDNIDARLYGGRISASASLDVDSRELRIGGHSNVDPHRVAQLLTVAAQRFLVQYDWEQPPDIDASARFILPAWVNRPPEWRSQILPTVQLAGRFSVGSAWYQNMHVTSAQSQVSYTNRTWDLPNLHAIAPEGDADMAYTDNEVTHDFHFTVASRMNPSLVRPVLPPAALVWLDDLRFSNAPVLHGQVWGTWHERERDGFEARVSATNFWFRGEKIDGVEATVDYTNQLLRVTDARLSHAARNVTASLLDLDLSTKRCTVTNVLSNLDINALRRVLGSQTPMILDMIHFDTPPTIRIFGSFMTHDPLATDLHFLVSGEHFHWTNMTADKIEGVANWRAREVEVTNLQASLYGTGTLVGSGVFDYQPKQGTDFRGRVAVKDIDLRSAVRGWTPVPSRVEGMLDGEVTISGGNFNTNTSWNGEGAVHVHDALLWDIPIFGIFSPILNAISKGMGDSRARDAGATFGITNGVVSTDNMEFRATGITLRYHGTLGPRKQINARVEAEVLRKLPGLGPILGLVLTPLSKLFEYKVSGTIDHPEIEPLYIPKFLLLILRPFHTMKTLIPAAPSENPPTSPPPPQQK